MRPLTLEGDNRHIVMDYVLLTKAKNPIYYFKVVYGQQIRYFNKHMYDLERVKVERDKIENILSSQISKLNQRGMFHFRG